MASSVRWVWFADANEGAKQEALDDSIGPDVVAGTYSLVKFDGAWLPAPWVAVRGPTGEISAVVKWQRLTIAEGGTWATQGAYVVTVAAGTDCQTFDATHGSSGTWERIGSAIRLVDDAGAERYAGTIGSSGAILTDGAGHRHSFALCVVAQSWPGKRN